MRRACRHRDRRAIRLFVRAWTLLLLASVGCASQPAHDTEDHHGHDHSGHHEHSFADAEKWAEKFDDPARDSWQMPNEVVRLMGLQEGMTVADLGAGTGYFLPYLSAAVGDGGEVDALDVEPAMVAYMERRIEREKLSNVKPRVVPGDDPELEDGSMDRILIVDTWHHIAERRLYAEKLLAGLRPGGELWIVDWTKESPMGPPPEFRIPPDFVMKTLQEAGFQVELVEEPLPRQYVIKGRRE